MRLSALNVGLAMLPKLNTKILNNSVLMSFCFCFAANVDRAGIEKRSDNFHSGNMVLLRETHLTPADILIMNQRSCIAV